MAAIVAGAHSDWLQHEPSRWERDIDGDWYPTGSHRSVANCLSDQLYIGLNPILLFGRYEEGGHFAPHTDGNTIIDFNHRSLRSVIIYLSDCKVTILRSAIVIRIEW